MSERSSEFPVFDGHNDVLLRILRDPEGKGVEHFFAPWPGGHLDWPRMRESHWVGGFFAIYVPEQSGGEDPFDGWMKRPEYALPLSAPIERFYAQDVALHQAALFLRMERLYPDRFKICTRLSDVQEALEKRQIAAILHMEGADAIDENFALLDVLYAAGLRSLGPVWSRPTLFGTGVPFCFPSSPDIGPGLTDLGKELVHRCNQLKIMIDLSHLNEKGFWDVLQLSDSPPVATHSGAHALCPSSRNLTDRQLDAIRERQGMVGVNFATAFIRPDGQENTDTPLEDIIRHFDYLINRVGVDHVGIGSDFDGATIPDEIGDVTGLPKLLCALRQHGYDDATLGKISHKNWFHVLQRTWET